MEIIEQFPGLAFVPDRVFKWDPLKRVISYDPRRLRDDKGRCQLLHEVGHALLNHRAVPDEKRYQIERDAWDVARMLASKLGVKSPELFIARQLKELRRLGY
jgi:hypothetical protein